MEDSGKTITVKTDLLTVDEQISQNTFVCGRMVNVIGYIDRVPECGQSDRTESTFQLRATMLWPAALRNAQDILEYSSAVLRMES